jgi:hypothetical protein
MSLGFSVMDLPFTRALYPPGGERLERTRQLYVDIDTLVYNKNCSINTKLNKVLQCLGVTQHVYLKLFHVPSVNSIMFYSMQCR